jgi:inner membrane protein
MDNLTHTLTGVMMSRAGLDRVTPQAIWIAALAANVPDIDAVSMAAGLDTYFTYHRAHTHAIAFLPLMAVLPVLAVAAISRQRLPWFRAYAVSLIAVASHLLLDYTNTYGIRLLLPFSDAWPGLHSTHIFDVWIWTILLVGLLWPMLSGLVSSEIGAKRGSGRGIAITALVLLAFYDTGRYLLHNRAMATLDSRLYDDQVPLRVVAAPRNVNPMGWNGWVETEKAWLALDVNLTREFDPEPKKRYWKTEPHPAIEVARGLPLFELMVDFARTPYWRVTPVEQPAGAHKVELIDLRFGNENRIGFTVAAIVDSEGRALRSWFEF